MEADLLHVRPTVSEPLVDEMGFSVELSAQQPLSVRQGSALAAPALVLSRAILPLSPYEARALVSVDDDELWIALEVSGPGRFGDEAAARAHALFDDLWTAVWLGAREGAEGLRSEAQLLALADASRRMDWAHAVRAASATPAGPAIASPPPL